MKKIDKFINKKIRDTILLMYRSYSLTQDSSVSFDQLSFILVINTEIFEEVVVSLDRAHFSRVRWTRKGPILGEKSVNGLSAHHRPEFCTLLFSTVISAYQQLCQSTPPLNLSKSCLLAITPISHHAYQSAIM